MALESLTANLKYHQVKKIKTSVGHRKQTCAVIGSVSCHVYRPSYIFAARNLLAKGDHPQLNNRILSLPCMVPCCLIHDFILI